MKNRVSLIGVLTDESLPRDRSSDLTVSLSGSDIPEEMVATEEPGGVQIRFVYPDEERSTVLPLDRRVTLSTGRHSGKILGIYVAGETEHRLLLNLLIDKLNEHVPQLKKVNQRLNYRLIVDLLRKKWQELLPDGK
jgi:hypothetical protein